MIFTEADRSTFARLLSHAGDFHEGFERLMKKTVEQRYPDAAARTVADQAIDKLPETATMTEYIDTWIAEYKRVGGKVKP